MTLKFKSTAIETAYSALASAERCIRELTIDRAATADAAAREELTADIAHYKAAVARKLAHIAALEAA